MKMRTTTVVILLVAMTLLFQETEVAAKIRGKSKDTKVKTTVCILTEDDAFHMKLYSSPHKALSHVQHCETESSFYADSGLHIVMVVASKLPVKAVFQTSSYSTPKRRKMDARKVTKDKINVIGNFPKSETICLFEIRFKSGSSKYFAATMK